MRLIKISSRKNLILWGLIILIFYSFYYSHIAWYNRYQTDDLSFAARINDRGLFGAIRDFFISWESNISSIFLFFLLDIFQHANLILLNAGIYLSNIIFLYFLFNRLGQKLNLLISRFDIFIISGCFISLLYIASRAEGGVIYWPTAQIAYFLPLNFLFLGLGFWIYPNNVLSLSAASLFMFLFAHSRINYDASFGALFIFFTFVNIWKTKAFNWRRQIPFLFFLIGILTYLMIPGVYKRFLFQNGVGHNIVAESNFFAFLRKCLIGVYHFYKMSVLNQWFAFVLIFAFLIGNILKSKITALQLFNWKNLRYFFLSFNLALLFHVIVILIALKTPIGYGRIFVFIEFIWLLFLVFAGLHFGTKIPSFTLLIPAFNMVALLFFVLLTWKYIAEISSAKRFAKEHDQRITYLLNLKLNQRIEKVDIPGLSGTYVFGYEDIQQQDTITGITPYPNYSLQLYYKLPFPVFLKQ